MPYYILVEDVMDEKDDKEEEDEADHEYEDEEYNAVYEENEDYGEDEEILLSTEERIPFIMERLNLNLPWEIDESSIDNAWTDGETITLTRTLVDSLDDDELAWFISHEFVHIVKGHITDDQKRVETFCQNMGEYWQDSKKGKFKKVLGTVVRLGLFVPAYYAIQRGQELEADREGVKLIEEAGFNSRAAQDALESFNSAAYNRIGIFRKHPTTQARIEELRKREFSKWRW